VRQGRPADRPDDDAARARDAPVAHLEQHARRGEGLEQIRTAALLPEVSPSRARSNVEFRDGQGNRHEVDLLVLDRRLHLVELKWYASTLRGDDLTWRRDGKRPEDSPLKLARRKAQRLAGRLRDELYLRAQQERRPREDPRELLPFVQEAVYLHHPTFRSALPLASERDLFAPPDRQRSTNLPSIADRLLEPGDPGETVDARRERTVVELLERIGLVQRRSARSARGSSTSGGRPRGTRRCGAGAAPRQPVRRAAGRLSRITSPTA